MTAYLTNKSFMHLLMIYDIFLSNKATSAQYFVLNLYIKTIFQGIIPDIGIAKVSIVRKS